jgi:hypothetical protein
MMRLACVFGVLGGLLAGGCMGYRVGPVLHADYKSVAVPMFHNKTLHPQLEAQITNAIIKGLQADGTLRIESQDNADVMVSGAIVDYERRELRSAREDTGVAREYRIIITAEIQARNRRTGEWVVKPTKIKGQADTFIGSDLQSAEFQVLPLVADDLARQVVSLLVESW